MASDYNVDTLEIQKTPTENDECISLFLPVTVYLLSSSCRCHSRHTGMKWRYATTKHRRTPQITKWRASSHKPISYLDGPGGQKKRKRWPRGVCQAGVRKSKHESNAVLRAGWWSSTEIQRETSEKLSASEVSGSWAVSPAIKCEG